MNLSVYDSLRQHRGLGILLKDKDERAGVSPIVLLSAVCYLQILVIFSMYLDIYTGDQAVMTGTSRKLKSGIKSLEEQSDLIQH